MTYDNFTIKAQESILKAQQIAGKLQQQSVDTPHIIRGIMETDEELSKYLFNKIDVNTESLKTKLNKTIKAYPKVKGTDKQYLTDHANKALARAKKMLPDLGDEYISIELMLLGILNGTDKGATILKDLGATDKALKSAIKELRKGKKVTDQHSEDSYNALEGRKTILS